MCFTKLIIIQLIALSFLRKSEWSLFFFVLLYEVLFKLALSNCYCDCWFFAVFRKIIAEKYCYIENLLYICHVFVG